MVKNISALLMASMTTFVLMACGDNVTYVNNTGMPVLQSGEILSKQACDTTSMGQLLFVMDSTAAFLCNGESWEPMKGADGKDGKDGKDGSDGKDGKNGIDGKNGADGKNGIDGKNGADGKDGKNGKDGKDGYSCHIEKKEDESLAISCETADGEVRYNVKNGADGKDGTDGKDVSNCQITEDELGTKMIVCGENGADTLKAYSAVCGSATYDPMIEYCLNGNSVEKKIIDSRDGQVYRTVRIGSKVWMAENLMYEPYGRESKIYCYKDDFVLKKEYGCLYLWSAYRDACPSGWHVPSVDEYKNLIAETDKFPYTRADEVGSLAGENLKTVSGWFTFNGEPGNGLDLYGFSAWPAGSYDMKEQEFYSVGINAYFWTSEKFDDISAYALILDAEKKTASVSSVAKDYARSIRCVMD